MNLHPCDENPYTDVQRAKWIAHYRGRFLRGNILDETDVYRNFCGSCGLAMEVPIDVRLNTDLLCEDCTDEALPAHERTFNVGKHEFGKKLTEV